MTDLAREWQAARKVVVLTGAGLSTPSGIPDFRSAGGLRERFRSITIQEFLSDEQARLDYWTYKSATWETLMEARPNVAHEALARLGRAERVALLVTQNVDGLHESSGFPAQRLVRIHGTDVEAACLSCGHRVPRPEVQRTWDETGSPPACGCGGYYKPATISFGQSLVASDLERALEAARDCDLLVAAGTSLVVGPVNAMVPVAAAAGASIAILTASETPFDRDGSDPLPIRHRLNAPLEAILPALAESVLHGA